MNLLFILFSRLVAFAFVFCVINDNYVCDVLGQNIIKIVMAVYIVCNVGILLPIFHVNNKISSFYILLFLIILSIVLNLDREHSLSYQLMQLTSIYVIYKVNSETKNIEFVLGSLILACLFSAFLCITSSVTISEYTFRKVGGMYDANEFATTMLIGISICLHCIVKKTSNSFKKVLVVSLLCVFLLALLQAGSKSAMLTLVILMGAFIKLNSSSVTLGKFFLFAFTVTCISMYGFCFHFELICDMLARFSDSGTAHERFKSWSGGLMAFSSTCGIGVGFYNYRQAITNFVDIAPGSRAAHNMYILTLVELGVCGFLAYIFFLKSLLAKILSNSVNKKLFFFLFLTVLCMGMTLTMFCEKYLWIVFGLIANNNTKYNENT